MTETFWSEERGDDITPTFRVRYLGCSSFKSRRAPTGISALQRPLLRLYAGALRQKCPPQPPLAQRLDILEYGLVIAEGPRGDERKLIVTRVLTPLSNAGPWAALRFRARALPRKGALGAAFVPLALSEIDPKDYVRLPTKHRFLVGVGGHPPLFAVTLRKVTSPRTFEVHAFACASAAQALALAAALGETRQRSEGPTPAAVTYWRPPRGTSSISDSTETPSAGLRGHHQQHRHRRRRRFTPSSLAESCEEERVTDDQYYVRLAPDIRRHHEISREPINMRDRVKKSASLSDEEHLKSEEKSVDESDKIESLGWKPLPTDMSRSFSHSQNPIYRDASTITDETPTRTVSVEVLARTIDLSSEEEEYEETDVGDLRRIPPKIENHGQRFCYFGQDVWNDEQDDPGEEVVVERHQRKSWDTSLPVLVTDQRRTNSEKSWGGTVIRGNGTERVTIRVNFPQSLPSALSTSSSGSSRSPAPCGVRGFRSDGHVRDWSTIERSSIDSMGVPQRDPPAFETRRGPKTIRWSSEEGLARQSNRKKNVSPPFWSLRRLVGFRSFVEAKRRTGKFFSSVRTRLVGPKKTLEDSEDSAYDTSEVCLSPSGRRVSTGARRQQSWSFHDLRIRGHSSPSRLRRERPPSSTSSSSSPPLLPPSRHRGSALRKTRSRRRGSRRVLVGSSSNNNREHSTTSSDSGVEGAGATPSDDISGSSNTRGGRPLPQRENVRLDARRGASFQRWSNTNIHDELGYIP